MPGSPCPAFLDRQRHGDGHPPPHGIQLTPREPRGSSRSWSETEPLSDADRGCRAPRDGPDRARQDELEAAINAAPDYVVAYENLGDIYARLAAVNYEKAIASDSRNKSAPAKLKLVREVLAPPAAPAAPAPKSPSP